MSAILSRPQCVDIEHQCTITKHAYCNSIITTYCTLKFIWPRPWVSEWLNDTYRLVPKLLADVHAWESLHICLALPGCGRSFYPNLGELCSEKGCHDTCPVFYILLPEKGCSTAKVSRLHKYIKSRAVRKFPYILWRSRNYFAIEIERIECVYDCMCDLSQVVLFPY